MISCFYRYDIQINGYTTILMILKQSLSQQLHQPYRNSTVTLQKPCRNPTGTPQEPYRNPTGTPQKPYRNPTGTLQKPHLKRVSLFMLLLLIVTNA